VFRNIGQGRIKIPRTKTGKRIKKMHKEHKNRIASTHRKNSIGTEKRGVHRPRKNWDRTRPWEVNARTRETPTGGRRNIRVRNPEPPG